MRTIYLHLGYHKTATTFLQRSIFPRMKKVNYIRQRLIRKDLTRIRVKKLSDLHIENIRDYFNSFKNKKPMLISYEGLSGSPLSAKKNKSQEAILKDLRRMYPASDYDVYVIVGIREQVSLLTSLYIQHIHQGGIRDASDFIKNMERCGHLENFYFHKYLQKVEEVFGSDHLHLMIYEEFKQNFSEEILKLMNYMGEPRIPKYKQDDDMRKINKSYGAMQVAVGRRLNRIFKTKGHPQGWLPIIKSKKFGELSPRSLLQNKFSYALHYKRYELPKDLQTSLKQRYVEGNKELAEIYNLSLPDNYFTIDSE